MTLLRRSVTWGEEKTQLTTGFLRGVDGVNIKKTKLRILHLPTNTGSHAQALSGFEQTQGFVSTCYSFEKPPFGIEVENLLFSATDSVLRRELKRWAFLFWAIPRFDVFHFNFGQKFLPVGARLFKHGDTAKQGILRFCYGLYTRMVGRLDLFILRLLQKKMFMTWQGDDARQGDFARNQFLINFSDEVEPGYYDAYSDERKRRTIRMYDNYMTEMFSLNPDLMTVLPGRTHFVPYCHVARDDFAALPIAGLPGRTPVIVHAPSHRGAKGTRFIITACDELRRRGYEFELRLIEGFQRSAAFEQYYAADLVIDQVLAGWYGGLAVEAMAMGKPVVAYIRDEDMRFIPSDMNAENPVISANPTDLVSVLADLLDRQDEWSEIGSRSRKFFEKFHATENVGPQVLKYYLLNSRSQHCLG
jgi:hypothetical protein